jgi:hypothetical protein
MTTVAGSIDSIVNSVETTTTPDRVVDGFTELLDDPLCPRTCSSETKIGCTV